MTARQKLYVYIACLFVSSLILGDVIGGKTVRTPLGPISVGMVPFPVTFLLTDVVNDFYGPKGARSLTIVGFWSAVFAWVVLQVAVRLPPDPSSYFLPVEFRKVFGGSAQLFVASVVSYLIGQVVDIRIFQFCKSLTESKHLWLRATGSTVFSQLVDTVTINFVFWNWSAAVDPSSFLGSLSPSARTAWVTAKVGREYGIKVVVAVLLTPLVYAAHGLIVRGLEMKPEAHRERV